MMRFSRASLLALSTAAAVTASSLTSPAFAEEQPTPAIIHVAQAETTENSSSGSSDMDIDDISEYVLLITGIVSILSAGLSLATALERSAR